MNLDRQDDAKYGVRRKRFYLRGWEVEEIITPWSGDPLGDTKLIWCFYPMEKTAFDFPEWYEGKSDIPEIHNFLFHQTFFFKAAGEEDRVREEVRDRFIFHHGAWMKEETWRDRSPLF